LIANDFPALRISVDPIKGANGELKKFEEISPFLYREVHGQDHIGFKKDAAGNWQFQLDYPFFIFQKVGLLQNKTFNIVVLSFGLGVLGLTILINFDRLSSAVLDHLKYVHIRFQLKLTNGE